MADWQPYELARGIVRLRESFNGRALKPGMEILDGREFAFRVSFQMGDDDKYPGECALIPGDSDTADAFDDAGIAWIASGDVVRAAVEGKG